MRRAVYSYASVLFRWLLRREYIAGNPLENIDKPEAPAARDRVLSDAELKAVWVAAASLGAPLSAFYRLLIVTLQRRSEVAGMNWMELDRAGAVWLIPAERTKTETAQLVPLSSLAIDELDLLAGGSDWPKTGYVVSYGRGPLNSFSKAKRAIDGKLEGVAAWRVHDLRRTGATVLQRLGVRFEVTEAVLNHVSGSKSGVAGIYQRHDWKEEKRDALVQYAKFLRGLSD